MMSVVAGVRRRLPAVFAALALVAAPVALGSSSAPAAADTVGVSALKPLPNYLYTMRKRLFGSDDVSPSRTASLFADPDRSLLFETGGTVGKTGLCPASPLTQTNALVSVDTDSYAVRGLGCAPPRGSGNTGGSPTDSVVVAVDSRDGLLFFSNVAADADSATAVDSVVVVNELTLKAIRTIPLPTNAASTGRMIFGLSYDAASRQLLVLRGGSQSNTGTWHFSTTPVVSVTAYNAGAVVHGSTAPVWDAVVSHCSFALKTEFGTANAYRSAWLPFVYVPCALTGTASADAPHTGVVRLSLGKTGLPDGQEVAVPAPGRTVDAMFDPGSDRLFLPTQGTTGTSLLTYDGRSAQFAGRAAIVDQVTGQNNPDINCVDVSLDPRSGRVVGVGPTGMTLIDGRRTPLAPGTTLAGLGGEVQLSTLPMLPPDARHPFRRILAGIYHFRGACTSSNPPKDNYIDRFAVFADRLSVTSDPPARSVDGNTFDGTIPSGSQTDVTYGANASGAGAHVMAIGSYGGVINNTNGGQFVDGNQFPLAAGNRNLLAGFVQQTHGTDGSAVVDSTALGDGNGTTASGVTQCTSVDSVGGCTHTPVPPTGPATGQQWPFPVAQCTRPGAAKDATSERDGFLTTTGYDAKGNPQRTAVPGSDAVAQASAQCNAAQPVAGTALADALLRTLALPDAAGSQAGVHVGSSQTSTVVSPPDKNGVVAKSVATARGIDISIGGFTLTIDSVRQTAEAHAGGKKGTAGASRDVVIAGVSVTSPAADKTVICQTTCRGSLGQVVAEINGALPSNIEIIEPQPAKPFGGKAMDANGHEIVNGSPGGYLSVVQAQAAQQYGDAQFNAVPASDGETTLLPALRVITLYDAGPVVATQLTRQIVDLAPIEVDAELGISVLPPVVTNPPPPPVDVQKIVSGVTPIPRTFVNGTPGSGPPVVAGAPAAGGANVYERALAGLGWIVRSPAEVLRIFVTLCLLALPVLLATRRHQWLRIPHGGSR